MLHRFGGKAALFLSGLALLTSLALGGTFECAFATPHITDFTLGMNKEDLSLREAKLCDETFPDILCGEVSFGGKSWQGSFHIKNGALDSITLTAPLADTSLEAAMQGFKGSSYVLYAALSEDMEFDFIQRAAHGESPESINTAFAAFLGELKNGPRDFVAYFYTEPSVYEAAIKAEKTGGGTESPGVACCLTVGKDGVSVFITSWTELHDMLRTYQNKGRNVREKKNSGSVFR